MPPDPAKIGFRPVTENDLPMLECWLAAPHVAAWWDAPQEGARKIADHISDPTVDPLLVDQVELDGEADRRRERRRAVGALRHGPAP